MSTNHNPKGGRGFGYKEKPDTTMERRLDRINRDYSLERQLKLANECDREVTLLLIQQTLGVTITAAATPAPKPAATTEVGLNEACLAETKVD